MCWHACICGGPVAQRNVQSQSRHAVTGAYALLLPEVPRTPPVHPRLCRVPVCLVGTTLLAQEKAADQVPPMFQAGAAVARVPH